MSDAQAEPGNLARAAAVAALERAIAAALTLDAGTRQRLAALDGVIIQLHCTQPAFDLFVLPGGEQLALATRWEGEVDARLSGTLEDFIRLGSSDDPAAELINGRLSLYGDSAALQQLQRIIRDLDPDWEAPLARLFGDVAGHQLGRALRWGSRRARYAGERLTAQGREWLREESDLLPGTWELTRFADDVDALAARVDRLEARLRRLTPRGGR